VHGRLLSYDAGYYRLWLDRARRFAPVGGSASPAARFLDGLGPRHESVVETLSQLPRTVVHGDFNAANVLVVDAGTGRRPRVAPVDWELAAVGPGLVDLATLISGGWGADERGRLVAAYAAAPGVPAFSPRQLACARLHVALRWLGWAQGWTPPAEQRHDWLADAIALAQELGL
jgi:aminoglycoside phosphotransferase (APT) family kinase protein